MTHTSKQHKKTRRSRAYLASFWKRNFWNRLLVIFLALVFVVISSMYGIAEWYIHSQAGKPVEIGSTFVANYSRYFGIDPKETLSAMLTDLGLKRIRLVSYWSIHEATEGTYDFSELDWQFQMAQEHGVKVSLAIGLRQPRWPECHMPTWARYVGQEVWEPKLMDYITATVNRYKNNPMLESYQLENEYLLTVFGECPDHDRDRLIREFNLVKSLDNQKPLIVSRSNNAVPSWPVGDPRADIVGAAVYKRVWDRTVTKRYFEYPLPAWYYAFLAGGTKLTTGRNTFIHELQAEPWLPDNVDLVTSTIEEQNHTMDAKRLKQRIQYGVDTGMKQIDLWGSEWWYWRKVKFNDPSLWNAAKEKIAEVQKN